MAAESVVPEYPARSAQGNLVRHFIYMHIARYSQIAAVITAMIYELGISMLFLYRTLRDNYTRGNEC